MPLEGMEELENAVGELEEKETPKVDKPEDDEEEEKVEELELSEEDKALIEKVEKPEEKKDEEEEDKDLILSGPRPTVEAVTKKYPNFFKDFPQYKDALYREDQYTQVFPTLEDAKTAKEDLEAFGNLEKGLLTGKIEDMTSTLTAIKELGEDVLPNFAINFLPAIQKLDQGTYYSVITPVLVDVVRSLYRAGIKNGNDNLKNTGLAAALYFFDDSKVASGEKDIDIPKPKIKEGDKKDDPKNEREQIAQERYQGLMMDVNTDYDKEIKTIIADGLDPDNVMSDFMKSALIESIQKRVNKVLGADENHQRLMKKKWEDAAGSGYSRDWKDRITHAALSRAKSIVPTIRNRARAEALGTKEKESTRVENKGTQNSKVEGARNGSTSKTQETSMRTIGRLDPKKIDWKGTSDLDIIQGKVKTKA